MSENQLQSETIIRDGKLFQRFMREVELGDEREIIQEILDDRPNYTLFPGALGPFHRKMTECTYLLTGPNPKQLHFFHRIRRFPLFYMLLENISELSGAYTLTARNRHYIADFRHSGIQPEDKRYKVIKNLWYDLPEQFEWFYYTPYEYSGSQALLGSPFIMYFSETGPHAPDLPNVFPEGRICTGISYRCAETIDLGPDDHHIVNILINDPQAHITAGLNWLMETPANNHLFAHYPQWLRFDRDGNTLPPVATGHFPYSAMISLEPCVEFYHQYKKIGNPLKYPSYDKKTKRITPTAQKETSDAERITPVNPETGDTA